MSMASEIDHVDVPKILNRRAATADKPGDYSPSFIPMRRKLQLHTDP